MLSRLEIFLMWPYVIQSFHVTSFKPIYSILLNLVRPTSHLLSYTHFPPVTFTLTYLLWKRWVDLPFVSSMSDPRTDSSPVYHTFKFSYFILPLPEPTSVTLSLSTVPITRHTSHDELVDISITSVNGSTPCDPLLLKPPFPGSGLWSYLRVYRRISPRGLLILTEYRFLFRFYCLKHILLSESPFTSSRSEGVLES